MRSAIPAGGSAWHRGMTISVTNDSDQVMELLWVREAWGPRPLGEDLPPLLVSPPAEVRESPDASLWVDAWSAIWDAVTRHAGRTLDSARVDELTATPAGSPVRAGLIAELVGPTWRDRFGDTAFDDRYSSWRVAVRDAAECPPRLAGRGARTPRARSARARLGGPERDDEIPRAHVEIAAGFDAPISLRSWMLRPLRAEGRRGRRRGCGCRGRR